MIVEFEAASRANQISASLCTWLFGPLIQDLERCYGGSVRHLRHVSPFMPYKLLFRRIRGHIVADTAGHRTVYLTVYGPRGLQKPLDRYFMHVGAFLEAQSSLVAACIALPSQQKALQVL